MKIIKIWNTRYMLSTKGKTLHLGENLENSLLYESDQSETSKIHDRKKPPLDAKSNLLLWSTKSSSKDQQQEKYQGIISIHFIKNKFFIHFRLWLSILSFIFCKNFIPKDIFKCVQMSSYHLLFILSREVKIDISIGVGTICHVG